MILDQLQKAKTFHHSTYAEVIYQDFRGRHEHTNPKEKPFERTTKKSPKSFAASSYKTAVRW